MYNCARLATLFEGYKHNMEQGLYPTFPPVSSLDFSLLHDEVSAPPGGGYPQEARACPLSSLLPTGRVAAALQQCPPLPRPAEPDGSPGPHGPRAPHHCTHGDGKAERTRPDAALFILVRVREQRDRPMTQSLSLGVQAPGAAQHGLQLILQPRTHPRGKRTVNGGCGKGRGSKG